MQMKTREMATSMPLRVLARLRARRSAGGEPEDVDVDRARGALPQSEAWGEREKRK